MPRLDLGAGMVVVPDLVPLLDDLDDLLDVYEIEPQTYWLPTPDRLERWRPDVAAFDAIVERGKPLLAHGVSAPVGGAVPPDTVMVEQFARSVELLGAIAASEHLASNTVVARGRTVEVGVFLPPCPTAEGVARAAAAVRRYQRALEVPFSVETGVNYLRPRPGERRDSEIVRGVVELTGCGVVLDLHNLWCNERNGRETVAEALANLPLDRVTEVHLAGGFESDGVYLDAHSGATPDPVLAIAADVLPRLPNARAVIFEVLPAYLWRVGLDPLREHLGVVRDLVDRCRRTLPPPVLARPRIDVRAPAAPAHEPSPDVWDLRLAQAVTGADLGAAPLCPDPGLDALRRIVDSGRRGRVSAAARTTLRLLLVSLAAHELDAVLDEYCRSTPPRLWGFDEGQAFLEHLESVAPPDVARLADAIALDRALMRVHVGGGPVDVVLDGDPHELAAALAAGNRPEPGRRTTVATIT
jgi:uncharacterized protein